MKRLIVLVLLITLFSSCSKEEEGCLSPPSWLIGTWEDEEDEGFSFYTFTIFTSNDIIFESREGGYVISESTCGSHTFVYEDVLKTSTAWTFKATSSSAGTKIEIYSTYVKLSDTSIGSCGGTYPCDSYSIANKIQ